MNAQRPTLSQNVATGVASAATPVATSPGITTVRVSVTVPTFVLIAATPVATAANGTLVNVSDAAYFTIAPGEKVAGILSTGTGVMSVTEMTA